MDADATSEVPESADAPSLEKLSGRAMQVVETVLNVGVDGKGPWKGSIQVGEQHLARHSDVGDRPAP